MKTTLILALPLVTALGWARNHQDTEEQPVAPVPHQDDAEASSWAEALRDPDLSIRRSAYERVIADASRSRSARAMIERWADSSSDVELAWTAELMLRELDRTGTQGRRGPFGGSFFGPPSLHRSVGPIDLFEEFEQLFDDDLPAPFGGRLDPRVPLRGGGGGGGSQGEWHSQGHRLRIGPDGVHVELEEMVDGEKKVRTYEAQSMEELLETHPELEDKLGGRSGFGTRRLEDVLAPVKPLDTRFGERLLSPVHPRELGTGPRTDRLGVRVTSPRVEGLGDGVPPNVGLEIVEVLPGSLAEALGAEAGEIILKVAGEWVSDPEGVFRALSSRSDDDPLAVEVRTADGGTRTLTWTPDATIDDVF